MKKLITLIILFANLIGNAQCPAPSNMNIIDNIALLGTAELSWTETGTATTWEIAVIPNYTIGTPIPTTAFIAAPANPFTITGIPLSTDCYAFFVRSVCSSTDTSPWSATGSSVCPLATYYYLVNLSNDNFTMDNNKLQVFPNPAKNIAQIKSNSKIDTITVYDILGKSTLIQAQNTNEINVENLQKGVYLIEISTKNGKTYQKFVKE